MLALLKFAIALCACLLAESLSVGAPVSLAQVTNGQPPTVDVCESCPVLRNIFPIDLPKNSEARSPDGHYSVVFINSRSGAVHTLFLKDNVGGGRRKLQTYKTRVAILWNSSSDFFSVTDYTGTDQSRCTMMSVDSKTRPFEVIDGLSRQLTPDTWARLKDHLRDQKFLVEGWLWEGTAALEVNISTDTPGFPTGTYDVLEPRPGFGQTDLALSAQWADELELKITNTSPVELTFGESADGSLPIIYGKQCELVIHDSTGVVPPETRYQRIRRGEEQPLPSDSEGGRSGDIVGELAPHQSGNARIVPGIYYDLNPSEKYAMQLVCGKTKSNGIVASLRH